MTENNDYKTIIEEKDKGKKRHANKVDEFIGEKLRNTRILLGIPQKKLADQIKITVQQLNKYENGENRISAATISLLSNLFNTNIIDFFPTVKITINGIVNEPKKQIPISNENKEIIHLLNLFNKITNESTKSRIVSLVKQIANYE
jgi:transcriptional regulator with XRE-family HTH domain